MIKLTIIKLSLSIDCKRICCQLIFWLMNQLNIRWFLWCFLQLPDEHKEQRAWSGRVQTCCDHIFSCIPAAILLQHISQSEETRAGDRTLSRVCRQNKMPAGSLNLSHKMSPWINRSANSSSLWRKTCHSVQLVSASADQDRPVHISSDVQTQNCWGRVAAAHLALLKMSI